MSKTLTTYEALKANETKRVRPIHPDYETWWGQGALIDALNRGAYSLSCREWQAEEPLIERWAIYWQDKYECDFATEKEALDFLKDECISSERIVHLREVRP